jgi:hypothetical protein
MRQSGGILLILGIAGFFYCSSELAKAPPLKEGLSVRESLEEPAGRWDAGRYVALLAGGIGAVLLLVPRYR